MIRKVKEVKIETKTYYRAILSCGHKYIKPIPVNCGVKKEYFCHACNEQKYRESIGLKPQIGRRVNKPKEYEENYDARENQNEKV